MVEHTSEDNSYESRGVGMQKWLWGRVGGEAERQHRTVSNMIAFILMGYFKEADKDDR